MRSNEASASRVRSLNSSCENVASHLQKYRLYLKRLQGCSESTMENSPSREGGGSGGGSGEGSGGDTAGKGSGGRHGSGGDGSGNEYKREGSGSEGNDGPEHQRARHPPRLSLVSRRRDTDDVPEAQDLDDDGRGPGRSLAW